MLTWNSTFLGYDTDTNLPSYIPTQLQSSTSEFNYLSRNRTPPIKSFSHALDSGRSRQVIREIRARSLEKEINSDLDCALHILVGDVAQRRSDISLLLWLNFWMMGQMILGMLNGENK